LGRADRPVKPRPVLSRVLTGLLLCCALTDVPAEEFLVADREENEITVQHYPSDGDILLIWLVDHEEERPAFEQMLKAVNAAGLEIWRADLMDAYFLPRSSENERTLGGEGTAALLKAAHEQSDKTIVLVAYDRMPLALLRGAGVWQRRHQGDSRLAGAVLFYPNLFGPAPVAGEDPVLDPIVTSTNLPLVIYQPELGSQRWRLGEVMRGLWDGGSAAHAYLVPGVRDWFFMGADGDHGPRDEEVTALLPRRLIQFASLLSAYPKPEEAPTGSEPADAAHQVRGLVEFGSKRMAPGFDLADFQGGRLNQDVYRDKVALVNFWATWCPPCVEEIPSLSRLAKRYEPDEFVLLSIDFRETPETLRKFTEQVAVDFPVLMDEDGRVSMDWKVFSFPSTFLLDRRGRVRYSANRAIDWDSPEVWQVVDRLIEEE